MFLATYKTTLKNLTRALLLWIAFVFVFAVAMKIAVGGYRTQVVFDENGEVKFPLEYINDYHPDFMHDYGAYVQTLMNGSDGWIMQYSMPLFAVISVLLILNRDYRDNFFEIEKAGGVKPRTYFFGRLAGILTVNIIVGYFVYAFSVNWYFLRRNYLMHCDFTWAEYLSETFIRITRSFFCFSFLGILFYIAITYLVGTFMKSGFGGAVAGIGYLLFMRVGFNSAMLRSGDLYNFLSPSPMHMSSYWGWYDSEWFNEKAFHNPWTTEELILHTAILVGVSLLFLAGAYMLTRKRKL